MEAFLIVFSIPMWVVLTLFFVAVHVFPVVMLIAAIAAYGEWAGVVGTLLLTYCWIASMVEPLGRATHQFINFLIHYIPIAYKLFFSLY